MVCAARVEEEIPGRRAMEVVRIIMAHHCISIIHNNNIIIHNTSIVSMVPIHIFTIAGECQCRKLPAL